MTDAEIWAQTYGMEDIPEKFRKSFLEHMFLRAHVRAFGKDRFYEYDVREFYSKIGLDGTLPGRGGTPRS